MWKYWISGLLFTLAGSALAIDWGDGGDGDNDPNPPTNVQVSTATSTSGSFSVTWNSAYNMTSGMSYIVQHSKNGGSWTITDFVSYPTTQLNVSNVGDGVYRYRVCSDNCGIAASGASSEVEVRKSPSAPAKPGDINSTSTSATISWTKPAGTVTFYQIEHKVNSGSWSTLSSNYSSTSITRTGLANGSDYYYRVRACNVKTWSCSGWSSNNVVRVRLIPSTPAQPGNINSTSTSYTVSWTKPAGSVSFYQIQERIGSGSWATISSSYSSTSISRSGNNGETRYYRVRACNGYSWSCSSYGSQNVVYIRVPPSVPVTPSVPSTAISSVPVSWTKPSGLVSYYDIQKQLNGGSWSNAKLGDATPNETIPGLADGSWKFKLRACNEFSWSCSAYSAFSGASTVRNVPSIPAGISVPSTATGTASISWSAVSGATYYDIQKRKDSGSWLAAKNGDTNTSEAISGLTDGNWIFRVRACNQYSWACSGFSSVSSATTVRLTPSTPPSISVPSTSTGGVVASWPAVSGATYYDIQKRKNSGAWETAKNGDTNTNETFTGLSNGSWTFRVRACNQHGWACTSFSAESNASIVRQIPGVPASIAAPSTSTGNAAVSWSAVSGATYYDLQKRKGSGAWEIAKNGDTNTSENLGGLSDGSWTFRVRACNQYSWACSNYSSVSTASSVRNVPSIPAGINVPPTSSGFVSVSWPAVSGATYYDIQKRKDSGAWETAKSGDANNNETFSGLDDGDWTFRVRACNQNIWACSAYSASSSVVDNRTIPTAGNFAVPMEVLVGQPYTVSFNAQNYTSLEIQEAASGSTWSSVSTSTSVTRTKNSADTTWQYRAKVCNGWNCIYSEVKEIRIKAEMTLDSISDAPFDDGVMPVSDVVATIPGKVAVQGGVASYSIPIDLPPGRNGMQPTVSFSYSSRSGNGLAGVGWSLAAGGSVHRCAGVWDLDGESARNVLFDDDDKLCLNGQRLLLSSGVYGKSGAKYYPENSLAIKVEQLGDMSSNNGSFTVYYANGQTAFYGESENARDISTSGVVRSWSISRRMDSYDNNITYNYWKNGGKLYLEDIYYTGLNHENGNRRVHFEFEARYDVLMSYVAGDKTVLNYKLDKIETYVGASLVASYDLDYVDGSSEPSELVNQGVASRQSFLEQITLSRGDEVAKLTHVNWYTLEGLISNIDSSSPDFVLPGDTINTYGDFDGDGINDLFVINDDLGSSFGANLKLSTTNNWIDLVADVPLMDSSYGRGFVKGQAPDFTGDGRSEILGYRAGPLQNGRRKMFLSFANWNGQDFDITHTNIEVTCHNDDIVEEGWTRYCNTIARDVDGDGRDDVVAVHGEAGSTIHTLYKSDPSCDSGTVGDDCAYGFKKIKSVNLAFDDSPVTFADVDSDGVIDFDSNGMPKYFSADKHYIDLNSDGQIDEFKRSQISFGTGNGAFNSASHNIYIPPYQVFEHPFEFDRHGDKVEFVVDPVDGVKFIDIDNDGLKDVLVPTSLVSSVGASYCMFSTCDEREKKSGDLWSWKVWLARVDSSGDLNFTKLDDMPVIYGALSELSILDIDGDGNSDIVSNIRANHSGVGLPNLGVHVYYSQQGYSDRVHNVDDGIVSHEFKYGKLNDGPSVYDVDYQEAEISPYVNFNNGFTVVKEYISDNGVGGNNSTTYKYYDARFNKAGRGFQGFGAIESTNVSKGLTTRSEFAQFYPFTGAITRMEVRRSSDNKLISETDNTVAVKMRHLTNNSSAEQLLSFGELNATYLQNYIKVPFVKSSQSKQYKLNASVLKSESTQNKTLDAFGNVSQIQSIQTDTGWFTKTKTVNSLFESPDTSAWRINKVLTSMEQAEVIYVTSLGISQAQTRQASATQFTYDSSNTYEVDYSEQCLPGFGATLTGTICSDSSNLTSKTDFDYDNYGNVTRQTTTSRNTVAEQTNIDGNRWVSTQYTSDGYFPESSKNSQWGESKIASSQVVNAATGLVTLATDANGLRQVSEYNKFGMPLAVRYQDASQQLYAPTAYTQYLWCDSSCPDYAVAKIISTQAGGAETIEFKDSLNRTVESRVLTMEGQNSYRYQIAQTGYSALGYVIEKKQYRELDSAASSVTQFSDFDVLGRPGHKYVSNSPTLYDVDYTYDGLTTDMTVTGGSRILSMSFTKSSAGLMLQNSDADSQLTQFRYDGHGNPVLIRDVAGSDTTASYNGFGQKLSVNDPNRGIWQFKYNVLGELKWQQDANGDIVKFNYDSLGRSISRIPGTGASSYWNYDPTQNGVTYFGALGSENRGNFSRSFTLDDLGRVVATTTDTDGKVFVEEVKYDSHYGRMIGRLLDDGSLIESKYDSETGTMVQELDVILNQPMYTITEFDSSGGIKTALYGNGLRQHTSYYTSGQVAEICATSANDCSVPENVAQHLIYENQSGEGYDAFGNVLGTVDVKGGMWENYTYDDLHRLTDLTRHRNGISSTQNLSYDYDAAGNLTSKSDYASLYRYGNTGKSAGGNAGPNAVRQVSKVGGGTASFIYDDNGNLTSGDGRSLSYDLNNKPTVITKAGVTTSFYYDANGMRYKQVENNSGTVTTTYYGGSTEYQVKGSQTESRTYLGDWGLNIVKSDNTSQLQYVLRDRLGSVHTVTIGDLDATLFGGEAITLERRAFDAFGKVLGTGDTGELVWGANTLSLTPRGFTGHEHLQGVGLIHMNGRAYDPELGRFLSVDPFVSSPANSQSWNPYSYVMNNPFAGVDPSGYFVNSLNVGKYESIETHSFGLNPVDMGAETSEDTESQKNSNDDTDEQKDNGSSSSNGQTGSGGEAPGGDSSGASQREAGSSFEYGYTQEATLGETKNGTEEMIITAQKVSRVLSYEEYLQEIENGGAKIGKVSSADKKLAKSLMADESFNAEAKRIYSEAVASGRETQGIRIYKVNGDHYFLDTYTGSPCSNGSTTCMIPPPIIPYSNWELVLTWHPHPGGTSLPSSSDYISNSFNGSIGTLWYGEGKATYYRGERQ